MKLFDDIISICDLEVGDLVYTLDDDNNITQARVTKYFVGYKIYSTKFLTSGSKDTTMFYEFETPSGETFVIKYGDNRNRLIYKSVEDLRLGNALGWNYGRISSGMGDHQNMEALKSFMIKMKEMFNIVPEGDEYHLYFNDKISKRVMEYTFNFIIDDSEANDFYVGVDMSPKEYQPLGWMLEKAYYRTKEEALRGYKPEVLKFADSVNEKEIESYVVKKMYKFNNALTVSSIHYKKLDDAILKLTKDIYVSGYEATDDECNNFYFTIYPVYNDGSLGNLCYKTPKYKIED